MPFSFSKATALRQALQVLVQISSIIGSSRTHCTASTRLLFTSPVLLAACAPKPIVPAAVPTQLQQEQAFPLVPGLRWVWRVEDRTPGGRVLLFFKQDDKVERVATWTLTLGELDADGHIEATIEKSPANTDEASTVTTTTLWQQQDSVWMDAPDGPTPAFEAAMPPYPVSTERVPCVLHMLGGIVGTCSPAPGGPLGRKPLIQRGVLDQQAHTWTAAGGVMLAILTAGTVIPGGGRTVTSLILEAFDDTADARFTTQDTPLVDRWLFAGGYGAQRVERALRKGPRDREQLAALALHVDDLRQLGDIVDVGLPTLHPDERPSVIRALFTKLKRPSERMRLLLRARPHLTSMGEAQRRALEHALGSEQAPVGLCLLEQDCLYAEALARNGLGPDALEAIEAKPTVRDAPVLALCTGQDRVAAAMLAAVPEGAPRQRMLMALLEALDSPHEQAGLIEDHIALARQLGPAERQQVDGWIGEDRASRLLDDQTSP